MPPPRHTRSAVRGDSGGDHGGLSIFTVVITLVVVVFLGAIVDFEQKLEARHDANVIAQEAARAGAGQVDRGRAYARGLFTVDRDAAIRAANAYLRASGHPGSVTPVGSRGIRVTVVIERPAIFLTLIGTSTMRVRGQATADLVTGVEAEP
jgi:hypothetical protein